MNPTVNFAQQTQEIASNCAFDLAKSEPPVMHTASRSVLSGRFSKAAQQLSFLWQEMTDGQRGLRGLVRFIAGWTRVKRAAVAAYRCQRFWWLLLGPRHGLSRFLMWPLYLWCRFIGGRHEIRYDADIGPGFRIVHPALPCVISGHAVVGANLSLVGGNVIGKRGRDVKRGEIRLGDNVMLGVCSLVLGPVVVGDRARIGAGAIVVKDVPAGGTVANSPARVLHIAADESL